MKHLSLLTILLVSALLFSACGDDDEPAGPPRGDQSITEIVQSTDGLNTLNSLLSSNEFSGLRQQLAGGEYSLLAPNDAAFQNLLTATGAPDIGLIDVSVLSNILSYHIVPNQTLQIGQLDSSSVTLLQEEITFTEGDSVTINAEITVQPLTTIVSPEPIYASNGVVHVIDEVLLPPSIQATASDFGTVAGLMDILTDVGLMNNVAEAAGLGNLLADNSRTLTLIAPTGNFLINNNLVLDETGQGLQFFAGNQIVSGIIDVASPPRRVTTLTGMPLYLSVAGQDAIYVNGQVVLDVGAQAGNGQVLYNLSNVLEFPTDVAGGLGSITEATGQTFSIFQTALSQTGLTLDGEKTLFVPTDSAFIRAGLVATIDSASRIDNTLLAEILTNHVVDGVSFLSDLSDGTLTTVGEGQVTVAVSRNSENQITGITITDANAASPDARVTFVNEYVYFGSLEGVTELTNVGVIHTIDQLLLPQ